MISLEVLESLRQWHAREGGTILFRSCGRGLLRLPPSLALAWAGEVLGTGANGLWTANLGGRADGEIHSIIAEGL